MERDFTAGSIIIATGNLDVNLVRIYPRTSFLIGTIIGTYLCFSTDISANAETAQDLENQGWKVVLQGTVSDEFKGCDFNKPVPIDGGYVFICSDFNYRYAYKPVILVYKLDDKLKYVIDREVFNG